MFLGQRLIVGIDKPYLSETFKSFIKSNQIGGVILFDHNGIDLTQIRRLIQDVNQSCDIKPFVAIDFEGGRVRRFKNLLPNLDKPSEYRNDFARLRQDIDRVAKALTDLGVNVDFAPVADLSYSPLNQALNDRTYSAEPDEVIEYCRVVIESLSSHHILSCAKHFPGLGSAVNDPHLETAISCLSLEQIARNDLKSFRGAAAVGVQMLMTTHMIMSAISGEIVTFEPAVEKLARKMGFDGILICDDLSMGAVKGLRPLPEMALETLCAGHDIALICHDHEKYNAVYKYLEDNMELLRGHGHQQALDRIANVKKSLS
jgi:beta-N-acetylhexosaminidase